MEISGSAEETVVDITAATSVTAVVTIDEEHAPILLEKIRNILLLRNRRDSFLLVCMLAVSLDPLFLYIPVIDEDLKCLIVDGKLRKVALACRSLTDFHYIMDNLAQFSSMSNEFGSRDIWRSHILTNFFATVPIPHIVFYTLHKMRGSNSHLRMFLNSLLVLQYVPRVLRIYQLRRDVGNANPKFHWDGGKPKPRFQSSHSRAWVGGLFMFFMFILASHILGAFWYFFSFQRNIDCWLFACKRKDGCELGTLECRRGYTTRNITLLNDLCPINLPNATVFNFGIFLDALQSGMLNSMDFPQKFLHCFWWGLRNLSSFGQNLETSTYAWENLFAILIGMIGMLVVLVYLNAILQTYMQMQTKRSDLMELKEKRTTDIETWLCVNDLSGELKAEIMECVLDKLNPEEDVNNVKVLSILPSQLSLIIKKNLCSDMLQKVPMFSAGGERSLDLICGYLKPVIYTENSFIIQEGDPVDKMLFIIQGVAFIYRCSSDGSGSSNTSSIAKGDHYGEELLNLAPDIDNLSLPKSKWSVKCSTYVEGFILMAEDLIKIKISLDD